MTKAKYFTTLTIMAVVSIVSLVGLVIALLGGFTPAQDPFNGTTTHRTVLAEPCVSEWYEHCKAVRVYEDGVLVEFYITDEE